MWLYLKPRIDLPYFPKEFFENTGEHCLLHDLADGD